MRLPWKRGQEAARSLSIDEYIRLLNTFSYNGVTYTIPGSYQEEIGGDFRALAGYAYKADGVVFACMLVRQLLFSEARFQYRRLRSGRPGDLFGDQNLALLERPWPGGTTGDLLTRMIQYADLAGNAFVARRPNGLTLLRPDWVDIVIGSPSDEEAGAWDVNAEVMGYVYYPGGKNSGKDPVPFLADQVAHFAPTPDPEAQFKGMSWLTPVIREIMADKAATDHKLKFFENGATPNLVVKLNVEDLQKYRSWVETFREQNEGANNAYKTLFLGAGHDATPVGANFKEIEFKTTQGAGETRIAAAAGVPPVIVGLSEGLEAATYSNYGQARRRFADGTMRPLWRNAAASLATLIPVPAGAELWYDDRDIPFLAEDQKDAAEVFQLTATAMKSLVDGGWEPDAVVDTAIAGDLALLRGNHTGLNSVQLQPPGTGVPASNGAARSREHAEDAVAHLAQED